MTTRSFNRPSQCGGFGLVELMISILLGLIVIGAVTSLVLASLRTDRETLQMTRLTQDLRSVMALVTGDIRRAGYWPYAIEDLDSGESNNPHLEISFDEDPANGASCIRFSRHEDGATSIEGFRFDAENFSIEAADGPVECNVDSGWIALTDDHPDDRLIEITDFNFRTPDGDPFQVAGGVTIREIVVSLEGRLVDDPTVTRRIEETIRVRNDRFN